MGGGMQQGGGMGMMGGGMPMPQNQAAAPAISGGLFGAIDVQPQVAAPAVDQSSFNSIDAFSAFK